MRRWWPQVSKLPTAVLSTTKKAKERAKKKDEAKAGKPGAAASMDIDSPKAVKPDAKAAENGKSGDVKASAGGKDGVGSKDVKDDTDKEKKDAEKAKEEEEKAENAKCPFTMENPVRCAWACPHLNMDRSKTQCMRCLCSMLCLQ